MIYTRKILDDDNDNNYDNYGDTSNDNIDNDFLRKLSVFCLCII